MQKIVISDETMHSITVKDTKLSLTVSKKAIGGATEVPGASFTITEKDDPTVVLDSWVSTDRAHIVTTEKMTTGKHYILSETKAPAGYAYTNDIEFVFEKDGSLRLITTAEKNGQSEIHHCCFGSVNRIVRHLRIWQGRFWVFMMKMMHL